MSAQLQKWDVHAAELVDTRQAERLRGRRKERWACPYCGCITTRDSRVCYGCRDLPTLDPHENQARQL